MFDPLSLIALFAPVLVDAGKSAVQKYIAPESVKPLTVAEKLQIEQSDIERLKALAEMDKPGENVSAIVADIRALMRPLVVFAVTAAWCVNPANVDALMVSSVWFYLFGERTLLKGAR